MKRIRHWIGVCALCGAMVPATLLAQNSPPPAVLQAFDKQVDSTLELYWAYRKPYWEAEFISEGREQEMTFDSLGHVHCHEFQLMPEEVPATVVQAVQQRYAHSFIDKADCISWEDGRVEYKLIGGNDRQSLRLTIDAEGNILEERTKAYSAEQPYEGDN